MDLRRHQAVTPGPLVVAAALLVVLPLAAWTQSGRRLALDPNGGLILTETRWWGLQERKLADIDGRAGCWQVQWSDGSREFWDGEAALGGVKLSAKLSAAR